MAKKSKARFGRLNPEYNYLLNPYPELRFTTCPVCSRKTGQKTVPVVIQILPEHLVNLNYTHRYCKGCDSLIGHKHEIEHILYRLFSEHNPSSIGNRYRIVGTMEKEAWRQSMKQPFSLDETVEHTHDLKTYEELRMTMGGWLPENREPPVMQPPGSTDWVKQDEAE